MDATSWVGGAGALVAGAASSLHCGLMCGPLACAGLSREGRNAPSMASYQVARVSAYGAVGAGLGALGGGVLSVLAARVEPFFPWVMVSALVGTAFGLGDRLGPLPGVGRVAKVIARAGARLPRAAKSAAIGLATPFLPCGLLYGVMISAAASGGAGRGAWVMGGFALGGVPALLLAQLQSGWLRRMNPRVRSWLPRAVPMLAALVLAWRTLAVGAPAMPNAPVEGAATVRTHRCH